MTETFAEIIIKYDGLIKPAIPVYKEFKKLFKKKDFSEDAVEQLYSNFKEGMIEAYLDNVDSYNAMFPIVSNKILGN